jgi:hypothetical protein
MNDFNDLPGVPDSSFKQFLWAYSGGELVCTIDYCPLSKSAYLLSAFAGKNEVTRIICNFTRQSIERSAECYFSN